MSDPDPRDDGTPGPVPDPERKDPDEPVPIEEPGKPERPEKADATEFSAAAPITALGPARRHQARRPA
mgnify:FL=1